MQINTSHFISLWANGTALVHKSTTKASLVTIITPKTKFDLEEDVWLRGSDRYYIETDLIHDAEIALFDASPTSNLADVKSTKIKAEYTRAVPKSFCRMISKNGIIIIA